MLRQARAPADILERSYRLQTTGDPLPSVVIAAHNEEAVLGACLHALLEQGVGPGEIVVVANGCTDATAAVARRHGVVVVDRPEPGKAGALNAGDRVAQGFPRVYLDADIVVPDSGVAAVAAALGDGVLAAVPARVLGTARSSWPVRAYFAVNQRLPVFRDGLFGRGMIVLSAQGRARFEQFPELVADDLFLDAQFASSEKREQPGVVVEVAAPRTTRDLVRRLIRVRRGNSQLREAAAAGEITAHVRPSDRWAWLRDVVAPHPGLWLAAVPYVAITAAAALGARRSARSHDWGRDESTRVAAPTQQERP